MVLPSEDGGEGVEVGVDHLLAGGRGVLGELHDDQPVVVVAPGEQYRLPLLAPGPRGRRLQLPRAPGPRGRRHDGDCGEGGSGGAREGGGGGGG